MESDAKRRAALLAAVSALGLSLGVSVPAHAANDESPKENRHAKLQSQYLKIDSHQLKMDSRQVKGESQQIKYDNTHVKTMDKASPK